MNYQELTSAVKHLQKTCKCMHCNKSYKLEDIHIMATAKHEGLFELKCKTCAYSTIVSVVMTPESAEIQSNFQREHRSISSNDILDIKNFLSTFDGNFKKIFSKKK